MLPEADDVRPLGVAIGRLWLDGRARRLCDPAFSSGWHDEEPGWRWTDGAGTLEVAGARDVEFDIAMTGHHWADDSPKSHSAPVAMGSGTS